MNWRRLGLFLIVVGGLTAFACGMEWRDKVETNDGLAGVTAQLAPSVRQFGPQEVPLGAWPVLTIIGAVAAVVGLGIVVAARRPEPEPR